MPEPGPCTSSSGLERRGLGSLTEQETSGRRALVRVDFNVPLEGEGDARRVTSDARIRAALPTIGELQARGVTIILASHLGRPGGHPDPELSLKPVAARLEVLLDRRIAFLTEPFDDRKVDLVRNVKEGQIFLLENLRYEAGESANDPEFARRLAAYGDLFVQDAFGTCHRRHASTVGVTEHLHPCVAGALVETELAAFARLLDPDPPFIAVLGGAKVAGKLETVRGLVARCERVCLGGGMANTFLLAQGREPGDSLVEEDRVDEASALLEEHPETLILPLDAVVARAIETGAERRVVSIDRVEPGWKILDIGPETVRAFEVELRRGRSVFWNGPLGMFETPPFDAGTRAIAQALADATANGAYAVAAGGDSIAALEAAGLADQVSHVSTGGGAALDLVSGKTLPGVDALDSATICGPI
ncbi:MAG TPA: phosphoglycerate kinase [Gemmatimonadota bacterium]|nr:phosphoglycerate kinase [Gemmatimonadota bacterium]